MSKKFSYKSSGVNIDKGNTFVKSIQGMMKATGGKAVLTKKGSFGALYQLGAKAYQDPVLVASSDGVGTKLLLAKRYKKHDTVGIDLVAMNVNDILCVGARPLFFLDYIACGKLNQSVLKNVVKGIAQGCRLSGCALIGGETAEMPDLYRSQDYDLAGFAVGVVERKKIIDGSGIKAGDRVIGLASSGLHSNGFSLVRRIFSPRQQKALASELLKPTRIYVREVLHVLNKFPVKGMAHITGGAFYDKLTKILPMGKCVEINTKSWPMPNIFPMLQKKGKISNSEMYRTFNMGIGFALVVDRRHVKGICKVFSRFKLKTYMIGIVTSNSKRKIKL